MADYLPARGGLGNRACVRCHDGWDDDGQIGRKLES